VSKDLREAISASATPYFMDIMTDRTHILYVGVTNDLARRVYQHKHKLLAGFTSRYAIDRLVYFEQSSDVRAAIFREKQLEGWLRARKVALIESVNPRWQDLKKQSIAARRSFDAARAARRLRMTNKILSPAEFDLLTPSQDDVSSVKLPGCHIWTFRSWRATVETCHGLKRG
jgi:putative endonuclease